MTGRFACLSSFRRSTTLLRAGPPKALLPAILLAGVGAALPAQVKHFAEFGQIPVVSDTTYSVALGDVDGDGYLDMVVGNFLGQNKLYLNDGTGTFTDATSSRMPADKDNTGAVALCDVDRDGDLDMVLANQGQNRLYLNDGTGTFTDATASRMPADSDWTAAMAIGDVEGAGHIALVMGTGRYPQGVQNRLYVNDGTGTFSDLTASRMPAMSDLTWSLALGDVDGDGDLDLVTGNEGQPRLSLNNGKGTFTDGTAGRMPLDWFYAASLALGDVDGDGDRDLIIANFTVGGVNKLYLNNGTGTFTDVSATQLPVMTFLEPTFFALGHIDVDGARHFGTDTPGFGQARLYLNDATGMFIDVTDRMPVAQDFTNAVALGDVDGDGDLDLAIGNAGHGRNRLYVNLLRQLNTTGVLQVGQPSSIDIYARNGPSTQYVAVPFLSTTRVSVPVPPFGVLRVVPLVQMPAVVIPQPAGVGTLTWSLPNDPALAGIDVFAQALVVRGSIDARLTNVTADRILP